MYARLGTVWSQWRASFLWQKPISAAPGAWTVHKISRLLPVTRSSKSARTWAKTSLGVVSMVKKLVPTGAVQVLLKQEDCACLGGCFDIRARFASCSPLQLTSSWVWITSLCIGNTCELVHWVVRATVLHGDGVEFGASGPPLRLMLEVNGGRRCELTRRNIHIHFSK